jgi:hypothetical protein
MIKKMKKTHAQLNFKLEKEFNFPQFFHLFFHDMTTRYKKLENVTWNHLHMNDEKKSKLEEKRKREREKEEKMVG